VRGGGGGGREGVVGWKGGRERFTHSHTEEMTKE